MCDVCHGIGNCPVCTPDPIVETCLDCDGTGHQYFYENPVTRELIEVSKSEYDQLPPSDRFDDYCETCKGDGEIVEEIQQPITARERRMRYWEDYETYHEPNFSL